VLTFNGRLTAMGGVYTSRVEVYDGEVWNNVRIPQIPAYAGHLLGFSSLATESHLFVFGKI